MKKLILALIFCSPALLFAQKGTIFPNLAGENLIHGEVNLPEDVKGKHTLIGLAFSKKYGSHRGE